MTHRPAAAPPALRRVLGALTALAAVAGTAACADATPAAQASDRLRVVASTAIIADLVRNVGGDRVDVASLVPANADPHSYEPTLRDVRDIVYADVAFTNHLMLEEQRIVATIDANLPDRAVEVALAESSSKYGANLIPLVEDASLDTIWLGVRVEGGAASGAARSDRVELTATGLDGPGALHAYLTGSFGEIEHYFDSSDGMRGDVEDTVALPPDAHTHLSWAFTAPGVYTLKLGAALRADPTAPARPVAEGELVIAVGVDPHSVASRPDAVVLDSGHADISVDLAGDRLQLLHDREPGRDSAARDRYPLDRVVVAVPNTALHELPGDPRYRFLGTPGTPVHQLAQAVLGKHVHGEVDPHLWHDPRNTAAYVQVIRDTLVAADPANAVAYTRNADDYLRQLDELDAEVRETLAGIPASRRTLITTHDSFGYFADAYDFDIAGFVTPNPAVEPSLAQRRRLTETIRNLGVPAVFLEPNLAQRSSTLQEVAQEEGIRICPILGDGFTSDASTYLDLMRANARSLRDCLG